MSDQLSLLLAVVCVTLLCHVTTPITADKDVIVEYCEDETFSPKCNDNQVVVMQAARYGRMTLSRCLTSSSGSVGCAKDILAHVDATCSGQRTCQLNVRDLMIYNPCAKDLRGYLEVQYTCLTVLSPEVEKCRQRSPVYVSDVTSSRDSSDPPTTMSGYLSNYVTELTGCGNIDSPWRIVASPGQRINFTLIDFGTAQSTTGASRPAGGLSTGWSPGGSSSNVCQVLAIIKDRMTSTMSETVCSDRSRQRHIMMSSSHDVEVRMVLKSRRDEPGRYVLIKYEVIGCPDLAVTSDTSFKRTTSGAVVGCVQGGGDIWRLTCEDGRWKGDYGNCSDGLNITIMAVVALLIGLAVLICGLVFVRRRLVNKNQLPATMQQPTTNDVYFQQKTQLYADFRPGVGSVSTAPQRQLTKTLIPGGSTGYGRPGSVQRHHSRQCYFDVQPRRKVADYGRPGFPPQPACPSTGGYRGRSPSGSLLYHSPDYAASGSEARYVEHIYESPTCARKDFDGGAAHLLQDCRAGVNGEGASTDQSLAGSLQYYEIDPSRRNINTRQQQQFDCSM